MAKETSLQLEELVGFELTEKVKQQIINDCRNPIKDWELLNSDNPVKLLYFLRVVSRLVLEKSSEKTSIAMAKLFNALDKSTNLMHAWESVFMGREYTANAKTTIEPIALIENKNSPIKTHKVIIQDIKQIPEKSTSTVLEADFTIKEGK